MDEKTIPMNAIRMMIESSKNFSPGTTWRLDSSLKSWKIGLGNCDSDRSGLDGADLHGELEGEIFLAGPSISFLWNMRRNGWEGSRIFPTGKKKNSKRNIEMDLLRISSPSLHQTRGALLGTSRELAEHEALTILSRLTLFTLNFNGDVSFFSHTIHTTDPTSHLFPFPLCSAIHLLSFSWDFIPTTWSDGYKFVWRRQAFCEPRFMLNFSSHLSRILASVCTRHKTFNVL